MRKIIEKCSVIWALLLFFQICLSKDSGVQTISCIPKEREALLGLKKSFKDPSGRLASWNSNIINGSNCCLWDGIACHPTTGHVTKIDLRNNIHVYPLPTSPRQVYLFPSSNTILYSNSLDPSVFEFKYLNYLDLSGNNFNNSPIPNFFGSMLELRYLNLSFASLGGKVPSHLGSLTQLALLDLSSYDYHYYDGPGNLLIHDVQWMSNLSSLEYLGLNGIHFSKTSNLIKLLTSLPLLSSLKLSDCNLQNISLSLGSFNSSFLTRIQLLDLSSNDFNGPIPKVIQNMTSLRFLYLSNNQFTTIEGGLLSLIGNSCHLKVFDLRENHYYFEGDVFGSYENESIGCNVYDLQVLDLSYTSMKAKIPDWLSTKFKNLRSLSLAGNLDYDDPIFPTSLSRTYNFFYGPIPASLGNLSSLEHLDLSKNRLTGSIPTSFGRLMNLRVLHLGENKLEGVADECFVQLRNLEVLDISHNLLKGVLTEVAFANLSKLHTLNFGYNEHQLLLDMKSSWVPPFQLKYLHGGSCIGCFGSEFPRWLQTQKGMIKLLLFNMSISSTFPTWLMGQNLTILHLSHNQIQGSLFTIIDDHLPNLERFFISHNLINDSLQSLPFKLKNLTDLDISHNLIQSPLPKNIVDQIPNLEKLFLNDNLINGSLPPSLCKWNNLQFLDLSNNRLSGIIQGCLLTSKLMWLDLSSNKFSGTFPCSNGSDLSNIRQLFLRNNNFEGSLPIVLKRSTPLQILDLQGNKFSGNIPPWVGDSLVDLAVLILRGNLFNGSIPSSLFNLANLQILDLANNQLQGSIPPNLHNLLAMTGKGSRSLAIFGIDYDNNDLVVFIPIDKNILQSIKSSYFNYSVFRFEFLTNIDLSKNHLVGFIPNEITSLTELIGLNLSHNNLTGTIPTRIGEMKYLESLDLSFNHLSGPIPRSISELNSLGVMKLSHNDLSEDIPREGHLSTFNEPSSFDANPYLCGEPLTTKCSSMKSGFQLPLEIENNVDEEEDKWEKWILYIMIIIGYVIGFWVVVGSLILKRSWRYSYFNFMDRMTLNTSFMYQCGGS